MKPTYALMASAILALCSTGASASGSGIFQTIADDPGGGIDRVGLPGVTIACSVTCREFVVDTKLGGGIGSQRTIGTLPPIDGVAGGWVYTAPGVMKPVPPPPVPLTPEEQEKARLKCLADCELQRQVQANVCVKRVNSLRGSLRQRPYYGAAGGAISGFVAARIGGAMVGAGAAFELVGKANALLLEDTQKECDAKVAADNNDCLLNSCKSFLWLPFLLLRRRRDEASSARWRSPPSKR